MNQVERSKLARWITWLIVGVVVLVLMRLLLGLLRVSVGILGWLLFTIVPLILLGWLATKLWDRYQRRRASRL